MERPFVYRRQGQVSFDANAFYNFYNDVSPENTLSSGQGQDANGTLDMTEEKVFSSSENWQFYFQQGRYFIRNYDYGADWQLGLSKNSMSVPRLMRTSGALGQQWSLTKEDSGKWKLTNGLLGNDSALALSVGNTVPGMQPSAKGTHWDIVLNPSAGSPQTPDMLEDVPNFEVSDPVTSSSVSATPSATSAPASPAPTLASTSSPSAASSSASISSQSNTVPPLSVGAVVGIAVGGAIVLVVMAFVSYRLWSRRKERGQRVELGDEPKGQVEYYKHEERVELGGTPVVQKGEYFKHEHRVELG
ncbi:hypothetical protein EJ04DRAFT_517871 [Polyplosphaeria fusca]|uniref:Uncharacterized protein n=1 Tax=Polyplosphaeria fusca TaxID=682080 RepID=A0A9P4V7U0_9PLEO|nr:hypothetical protein EJ04DRAFT_517871 [Polyplosphaeria fusca]